MKAKKFCIALLSALLLTCVSLIAFPLQPLNQAQADTASGTPTFTVIDGADSGNDEQNYNALFDDNTGTKYCIQMNKNPYVVLQSSSEYTLVTGYELFTGNDTADYSGRNPKDWVLYGCNDYDSANKTGTWVAIHTVTNDTTMGAANKTGYSFSVEKNTACKYYKYYKFVFTARRGSPEGENMGDWMDTNIQLSEIKITASIIDVVEIDTETELASVFANGGTAKLTSDIALTADLSLNQKTLELDLNGHVISNNKITVWATVSNTAVLILKDGNPSAAHADSSLPSGGVVSSELEFNRNASENDPEKACLYANGGTVINTVKFVTGYAVIDYDGNSMTTFMNGVSGCGTKLNGGLYYGAITSTNDTAFSTANKKVEFKIGDTVYATQFLKSCEKATMLTAPTVEGYTFIKWYNTANNSYYNFASTAVTADLTIKAMLMKEVATFAELKTEIGNGNSVKLTADITMTDNLNIASGQNVIIDLNGHVIGGNGKQINGKGCGGTETPGPSTRLTIIDSNPTATHEDSSLPIGGYINAKISITASSSYSGEIGEFYLYANGGTIKEIYTNSFAGYVIWSDGTNPSVIEEISGIPTVTGGLYYYDSSFDSKSIIVTYKDGDSVYAVLGMNGDTAIKKAVEPIVPVKSGYVFDAWYNGDGEYDFSTTVTANITLTAHWVEDNTAPVITGVVNNGVYCENKEVTVTDTYLDKVTVDGAEVVLTDGKFTLDMSSGADRVIVATDKALNSTTVTVKFGHTFGEDAWIDEEPATCTATGMFAHYECSACRKLFDENKTEKTAEALTIAILGHDYGTATYVWATNNQSCTASRVCSRDATHVDTASSSSCGWWVSKEQSCTSVEETTYQARFANSSFATQIKVVQTKPAAGHTLGDLVPYKNYTCTEDGNYAYQRCSTCKGYQYTIGETTSFCAENEFNTKVKLAAAHAYGDWTNAITPDCTQAGNYKYRQCSVCNQYEYIDGDGATKTCQSTEFDTKIKLTATGHNYTISTWIPAEPNTCTTAGYYAYHRCDHCTGFQYIDDLSVTTVDLCNEFVANAANSAHVLFVEEDDFASTVKLAATGHDFGDWVPAKAMECLTDGNRKYHQCSNCNQYEYIDDNGDTSICSSDEFDSHIKLESYGYHDTEVTYKGIVDGKHYHGNKCTREGCGVWDGDLIECSYDDWSTGETKHWHQCSVCEQRFDEDEHTGILVYNSSKHWQECSVCEKELSTRTAHTFGSTTATSCSAEGCGYKRFLDLTFTLQNYQIDGLVKDVSLALSTSNTEVKFTSKSFAIFAFGGNDPIVEQRDPTATVLRHQMYEVYFKFTFGQFYPELQSMDSLVLPEGASIKSLQIQLFGDEFAITGALFLPALAGETTATTVPKVEISFNGLQVGAKWNDSMVSVTTGGLTLTYISAYQSGNELDQTTTITDENEVGITLDILAPKGKNFLGYTKDNVTIANDVGEVMKIWVSPGAGMITVYLEVRSIVKEHTCVFDHVGSAYDDDPNNPDPGRYHRVYCDVCYKTTYVEHVFDGAMDNECDDCGFDERVVSPERIDITIDGYQIDAKVRDVTLSVGENDYGIAVKGNNYNNGYVIMYSDEYVTQKEIVAQNARFYPGIKYYLALTLTFNEPTDILDAAERLYFNGANVTPIYMTQSNYSHTSDILIELTPLVGTTTQQKVTNLTITSAEVPTNGQTFHVTDTDTDKHLSVPSNSGVLYAEGRVSAADGFHQEGFVLTYGFKYYVNVILVLGDGYHYNGMGLGDVTLTAAFQHGGSFQTVELVRAGYEIFDTDQVCYVEYKFLIQMDHEVENHVCFEQTIGYEGTKNGHYAVCKCGAMSTTIEQHVYENSDSEQCKLCGYARKLPITEMVFTVNYYIGQNPDIYDSGARELWASIDEKFGEVTYCNMYDRFSWEDKIAVAADMILAGKTYYAGIVILLDTKYDLSTLTTQTAVIRGIADEDIQATLVMGDSMFAGKWEVNVVFELPALDLPHIHGGALQTGTPATCEESGLKDSFTCTICNKMFDSDTKTVITDRTIEPLGHDWKLAFCEEAAQKGEGNFHDYYCSTCHEWKGEREECDISDDWQRDDNNHWRICEVCNHKHFLDEHDQAVICDSQKHWTACPVCKKEFGTHTAHTFENEQSTACSTEGCTYQRYSAIEIEVENYVVDGLMTEFGAVAHNTTNNVDMPLARAHFFDENIRQIEIWRDEGGLDFGATFQPETLYFVEFIFRCDNYFFDTEASIENIKLPAGFSVVELGHDTWRDGPETPRYNIFYIIAVMPQIGGVSQLEKVPDLQIEIGNFAVGEKVSDVTFAANADAEVVYREVGRSGLVLPETTVIDNKGFYTIKLAVSAPVGYTFRGYTADDVTVKNELGEVVSAEVSDNGNLLFVVIETRSGTKEHDCSANRDYLAADKDSITNPDPEHKHRTLCAICGDYTYENHVYDGNLDANCNLCGYKRYIKPDRLDIIVANYVIDGLVEEITISIAENDYGIGVVGTFNNDYHVYDSQGNNYFGDYSRFLPDEQYAIRFDVVANSIISFANVVEGNVYINGQLAEIKYAYASTNTTKITYELKLPKLTGTTTQQKATGISYSVSGVSLGGNLSDVVLSSTAENAAVIAVGKYFYRVNGATKIELAADVDKFTEGYQYYIQLRIKLADKYYAKGMGEGDVTLGNFPLVGEVTYMDGVLGAEISPGAGTIVTYTFKVLFEQGEEHVHKFTGENLHYDIDTKGHAVICNCGVLGERVAHVPSEENESVCSVCGGTIEEVLEKVEFTCSNYQVGTFVQLPALNTSPLVSIDTAVFSDEYDFETLDINSNSMIIMPNIRYALVVMCHTTGDVSGLTKEDYVLKGVGETDITASFLELKDYSSEYLMFIGFVLPELGGASAHIHGGTWIDEVPATCTASGTKGHYVCTICGKYFDEENAEIEDLTINALGHNFGDWIDEVSATEESEGVKAHKDCSVCGKHFDENGNEISDEDLIIEKITAPVTPIDPDNSGKDEPATSIEQIKPSDEPKESLSGGAIAGIAVGGTAVLGCGGFSIFWFLIKKKKFSDLF